MLEFKWLWAFALLPLPALFYWLWPVKQQQPGIRLPFFNAISQHASTTTAPSKQWQWHQTLSLIAWLGFITALASPQWIGEPIQLSRSSRDMFLAVDLSDSMKEQDMHIQGQAVDRLVIVKQVVDDFIAERTGTRLGLVVFGSNAYVVAPLTFDLDTVRQMLQELEIGMSGPTTAIGDAIGLAVKRLKQNPESQRTLILLTDGQNTAGNLEVEKAIELAQQFNVKIYTVGIGAQYVIREMLWYRQQIKNEQIGEQALKHIADATGGAYFRAEDPEQLQQIYQRINEMEPIEVEQQTFRPITTLFYWPLLLSFTCWFAALIRNSHSIMPQRA